MSTYNEKSKEYTMRYMKKSLEEFKLRYPIGTKDNLKAHIEKYSDKLQENERSMQGYFLSAVKEKMQRDIEQFGE